MKRKIILAVVFIQLFLAGSSHAKLGFYGAVAAKGGLGTSGSESESIESRDMTRFGAEATLGLHFGPFLFGGSAEYNIWNQRTKPSEVDDTNMAGKQINIAPVVGVGFGGLMLALKPQLHSKMTLTEKTADGDSVELSSPDFPGYTAQLNYGLGLFSFIGLEYTSITYKKMKSGSSNTTFDTNDRVNYSGWGIIYGFKF
jgi:hypothetical protein